MKVSEIAKSLNLKVLCGKGMDKEVSGGYSSDLLSWVMSHACKGNVWITVQIHPNIIAVAVLLELSCIIIPEGIEVQKDTLDKAEQESMPVLQSDMSGYALCSMLNKLGV